MYGSVGGAPFLVLEPESEHTTKSESERNSAVSYSQINSDGWISWGRLAVVKERVTEVSKTVF